MKVQRYGGLVNVVGPKSDREEVEKKESSGTSKSAKKGGFFSWMGKKSWNYMNLSFLVVDLFRNYAKNTRQKVRLRDGPFHASVVH